MTLIEICGRIALGGASLFVALMLVIGIDAPRSLGWYRDPRRKRYVFDVGFLNPMSVLLAIAILGSLSLAMWQLISCPPMFPRK